MASFIRAKPSVACGPECTADLNQRLHASLVTTELNTAAFLMQPRPTRPLESQPQGAEPIVRRLPVLVPINAAATTFAGGQ
jgi:hypothetical protein